MAQQQDISLIFGGSQDTLSVHEAAGGIRKLGFQPANWHVEELPIFVVQEVGHLGLKTRLQQQVLVLCCQGEREEDINECPHLIYLSFHKRSYKCYKCWRPKWCAACQEAILGEAHAQFPHHGRSAPAVRAALVQLQVEDEGGTEVSEDVECGDELLSSSMEVAVVGIREQPRGRLEPLGFSRRV